MFEWLWQTADEVRHAPVERKEAVILSPDRVKDDPYPNQVDGQKFQSGGSYFGVRLAGLHIVDARQFGSRRFPLCVSLAEFKQRGRERSVAFTVGPREILGKLQSAGALKDKDAKPGWIELSDIPIVPPTPVGVGNLSLFVGLYSVEGDDMVSTLLDVVGNLSKSAGAIAPTAASALNPALDVAKAVYTGFGSLIGLNSLQPLVQAQNGRALQGTGSGYLVVANAAPDTLRQEGVMVRQRKLCRGESMVTDMDYCVVAIERYSTILEEATGIAPDLFDSDWDEVLKALGGENPGTAKEPMRKLMASIRGTPALIDADRTAAMTAYLQRYTEEVALAKKVDDATRGTGDALANALGSARDQQAAGGNQIAADKLSAVFDLVNMPRRKEKFSPAAAASEARVALERVGAGGDDAVADALLKAV
jgi:hypothetical protein